MPDQGFEEKKCILLVEDDEQSARFIEALLGKRYTIHVAGWADDAWTLFMQEQVDLILMDISLPGGENGLDITRRIRAGERHPDVPIIAVTAHAFHRDRINCLEAGCNEYISKPFDRKQLIAAIENLLG